MGVGDLNFDNVFSPTDIFGSGGFEQYLYSQNAQFNPAADVNADGLVDNRDLFDLGSVYVSEGASQATLDEYAMALLRRGNMNLFGGTDAFDIDFLYNQFGSATWHYDLNVDGVASQLDVDALVQSIFGTEYGDTDLDGDVDLNDLSSLAGNYGQIGQGWSHGDFDGDGDVDLNDLGVLAANYGAGQAQAFADFQNLAAVPEPGVMSLLGTGLLLLGRRSFGR
jgi:hypothetical protein